MGYSPWDHKESDTTEHMCMHVRVCAHTHTHTHTHGGQLLLLNKELNLSCHLHWSILEAFILEVLFSILALSNPVQPVSIITSVGMAPAATQKLFLCIYLKC